MNIAMIGHKEFPSRDGGIEVVVYELATRLTAMGHKITLYNRGRKKGENHCSIGGVEVVRVPALRQGGIGAVLSSFNATVKILFRRFDIIHYHASGPSIMVPLAKLFRRRVVATIHGFDWENRKWSDFAKRMIKFGEKTAAKYADEVIVVSPPLQAYFREKYHRETVLINNAVTPVRRLKPKLISERLGLAGNDYILFVSRIDPRKGVDYLIDAFNQVRTDMQLIIAGGMQEDEYCRKLREAAADNGRIHFIGFAEGELLEELFSNCALYVLPSEAEGLPLCLLEAMSAGARCLASDIPINRSVLGSYGTVFRSKDVCDLRDQLQKLVDTPDDPERKPAQIEYIQQNYDYERVVRQNLEVYQRTAKKKESEELKR